MDERRVGRQESEWRESLPQPIRDTVIERARLALQQIDAAQRAAEAEVTRLERQAWRHGVQR